MIFRKKQSFNILRFNMFFKRLKRENAKKSENFISGGIREAGKSGKNAF